MAKSRSPCTLIFVSGPGAAARQLRLPRNWPLLIVFVSVLSLGLSLLAGRKVRAWFDEGAARIASTDTTMMALAGYSLRSARVQPTTGAWATRSSPFFSIWSSPHLARSPARLRLFDVNAKRSIAVLPFARDGLADPHAFVALREFMRCRRTGQVMEMNPALIQLLLRISQHFKAAELQVISAHRAADGVVTSEASQHAKGTAADIRVTGVSVETLTEAARELGAGGVGTYFRNRFVHVDVREKRYFWREEIAVAKEPSRENAAAAESADSEELAATEAEEPAALPTEAPAEEASAAPLEETTELPAAKPPAEDTAEAAL